MTARQLRHAAICREKSQSCLMGVSIIIIVSLWSQSAQETVILENDLRWCVHCCCKNMDLLDFPKDGRPTLRSNTGNTPPCSDHESSSQETCICSGNCVYPDDDSCCALCGCIPAIAEWQRVKITEIISNMPSHDDISVTLKKFTSLIAWHMTGAKMQLISVKAVTPF